MNWDRIMPPPKGSGDSNYMTAVTEIDGELVEILDVEKILDEISPNKVEKNDLDEVYDEEFARLVENRKPTVLVADDSRVALNQVCSAIKKMNLEVVKAHNGREAYSMLREYASKGALNDQVSLIISDVEMPEMDGYTLCSTLRKDPSLKSAYVILHTSLSGVFNQSMVSKAGANDFIPKFNPVELAKAVKKGIILTSEGKSGAELIMHGQD
jgi:two-component system chemotaxis response regulator CheV